MDWAPSGVTALIAIGALFVAHRLLSGRESGGFEFRRHTIMLVLTLIAFVALVIALPLHESTREELLRLFGLLLSAA